jgi:UDP-N-acetylmuramyl pentapeptide phosphotransferase/UDP-N-acetylglucosamine-1-phosphate transferase
MRTGMNLTTIVMNFIVTNFLLAVILLSSQFTQIGIDKINGPQKQHKKRISRLGGLALFSSSFFCIYYVDINRGISAFTLVALALIGSAFAIGLVEDLTNTIHSKIRFMLLFLASFSIFYMHDIAVHTGFKYFDLILQQQILLGFLFTAFCFTGIVNSYNIIDGFHGLSSLTGIISLATTALIAHNLNNIEIQNIAISTIVSAIAFILWNFPKGKIFLGDAGAYYIGAVIAICSIKLSYEKDISPMVFICLNLHPLTETLLTIYRRLIQKTKIDQPDRLHLHTLIHRRLIKNNKKYLNKNARTSLPFIFFSFSVSLTSYFLRDNSLALIFVSAAGLAAYVKIYIDLVKFRL